MGSPLQTFLGRTGSYVRLFRSISPGQVLHVPSERAWTYPEDMDDAGVVRVEQFLRDELGVRCITSALPRGVPDMADGAFFPHLNLIWVPEGLDNAYKTHVVLHEATHALYRGVWGGRREREITRLARTQDDKAFWEIVAEGTAHVVSHGCFPPVGDASMVYAASYALQHGSSYEAALQQATPLIVRASAVLLDVIEGKGVDGGGTR